MSKEPCELNIAAAYPDKDETQLKYTYQYIKALAQKNISNRGELRTAIKEFATARKLELKTKLLTDLDTIGKGVLNLDRLSNPKFKGDRLQGALSLFEQTSSVVENAGINVEAATHVFRKQFWSSFDADIQKTGFAKEFYSGKFDSEIRDVIRTGKPYEGAASKQVNAVAAIVKKSYASMNFELNSNGMRVTYRPDYDGPMVHDGSAINGKFVDWAKALNKALNIDEEFKTIPDQDIQEFKELLRTGEIEKRVDQYGKAKDAKLQFDKDIKKYQDAVEINKKLGIKDSVPLEKPKLEATDYKSNKVLESLMYTYEKITAEDAGHMDDTPRVLEKPVSIANRRSYAKTFTTWRDGSAVQEYLDQFGKYKSVAEQMEYYTRTAARDSGIASVFGADYNKGVDLAKRATSALMKRDGALDSEINKAMIEIDRAKDMMAKPKTPEISTLGQSSIIFRKLTAQAHIGMIALTKLLMDPVAGALQNSQLLHENLVLGMFKNYGSVIGAMLDANRSDAEAAFLYSTYDLQSVMEEAYSRGGLHAADAVLMKTGSVLQKLSGGEFIHKTFHVLNAKVYLKALSDMAAGGEIGREMRADLNKFGITRSDLDIIRSLDLKKDGMRNVFRLNADDIMKIDSSITDREVAGNIAASLKERVNMWLLEKIKQGSSQAGNREKRILSQGTLEGTLSGEALRFLTQFKMTHTKMFLDATVGANRRLAPDGLQAGPGSAGMQNRSSLYNAGGMAALLTTMGAMNLLLNTFLSQDKKQMKRWEEGDPTLLLEAMARGGVGNMAGELLDIQGDKARAVTNLLGTPAIKGLVTPFTAIHNATIDQNPAKAVLDVAKTFTPGANHFILKPFVQSMTDEAAKMGKSSSRGNAGKLDL